MKDKNTAGELSYFIFDLDKHAHFIDDFLQKASEAHNDQIKSPEWFRWKFFDNPYGPSILACVATEDTLIGCVAYGLQPFMIDGERITGVLSFETFVDKAYQGRGLFTKLINFAEEEVKDRGVKIMLNFPNSQSLPGFLKRNWKRLDIGAYYLRPYLSFKLLDNFKKIRTPFVSLEGNLEAIKAQFPDNFKHNARSTHEALITSDYLKYRFFSFPNGNYHLYSDNTIFAIGRLGHRAGLIELQILFLNLPEHNSRQLRNILKDLRKRTKADLISYPTSIASPMIPLLKRNFFVKVPNKANVCYKILDDKLQLDMNKLELSAINFHTY